MTSKNNPQDIAEGLESGADDYISKPFDNYELHARINVGMLAYKEEILEPEKNKHALEEINEICQEMSQPLKYVLGWPEILLMDLSESDSNYQALKTINEGIERIGTLNRIIRHISNTNQKKTL